MNKEGSIRLHPKLGLNPKLGVCPLCKEDNGDIILPGAAVKDEYPMKMYGSICKKCEKLLKKGNVGFFNKLTTDSAIIKGRAVKKMFPDHPEYIGKVVFTESTFWGLKGT